MTSTDLCPEETVTLLLYIVVDNSGHFLLPNLQAVDVDVILDVLKRATETIHPLAQGMEAG